jgi:glycerophosphoryl diester phosphodiesterase
MINFELPSGRPLVIAHRAANDRQQLQLAARAGVDVVEADIWRYRDRLEVRHRKTMGPVPLLWDRWELAPGWTPRLTLDALLHDLPPGVTPMLDLKGRDPALAYDVFDAIERHLHGRTVIVCSQSWDLLDRFRAVPSALVAHSVGSRHQLRAVGGRLIWHDHHAISIDQRLLTPAIVCSLKERARLIMSWPVNTVDAARRLHAWGVHGIITDDLNVARAVRAWA